MKPAPDPLQSSELDEFEELNSLLHSPEPTDFQDNFSLQIDTLPESD